MVKGFLYLVATPIGNLEDITLRALKTLKEVDIIACEDTRQTLNLLNHYQIKKPLISYFGHNEKQRSQHLVQELLTGKNIALVSNAGTPIISDPGYELVKKCIDSNIIIKAIPGTSACLSALIVSGLSSDRFVFEGFLPRKTPKRKKRLQEIAREQRTVILYESPYRLTKTLSELKEVLGECQIVIARELTKFYEEIKRGTIEEIIQEVSGKTIKGEITLIIAGNP
jgi:16S rRNA (cytidine1402-2'-O)-methyltransferase